MNPIAKLTDAQVQRIRSEGRPDSLWARLFRVSVSTVRHARVGINYKAHPVPVDSERRRA